MTEAAQLVLAATLDRSPTLGRTRFVCVDGPAGSGKTTLGTAVADLAGANGSDVVAEPVEKTRARLGEAFADALLLDQVLVPGAKAAALGWSPQEPTLFDDLAQGSYAQHG